MLIGMQDKRSIHSENTLASYCSIYAHVSTLLSRILAQTFLYKNFVSRGNKGYTESSSDIARVENAYTWEENENSCP